MRVNKLLLDEKTQNGGPKDPSALPLTDLGLNLSTTNLLTV
jgi:hypothetical protein